MLKFESNHGFGELHAEGDPQEVAADVAFLILQLNKEMDDKYDFKVKNGFWLMVHDAVNYGIVGGFSHDT